MTSVKLHRRLVTVAASVDGTWGWENPTPCTFTFLNELVHEEFLSLCLARVKWS